MLFEKWGLIPFLWGCSLAFAELLQLRRRYWSLTMHIAFGAVNLMFIMCTVTAVRSRGWLIAGLLGTALALGAQVLGHWRDRRDFAMGKEPGSIRSGTRDANEVYPHIRLILLVGVLMLTLGFMLGVKLASR